jgi:hypothetical protein
MARDYDRSEAFPPLGARSDTGTLFGPTMVLVAVTIALFTWAPRARPLQRLGRRRRDGTSPGSLEGCGGRWSR